MSVDEWRTSVFRQNMIHRIDELMQQLPMPLGKSATEMEHHVFQKAHNKDDYLAYIQKLLNFIKNKINQNPVAGANTLQKGMQDPIGALQSLARQGTTNNINLGMHVPVASAQNPGTQMGLNHSVGTNLLQTLSQQRPGQTVNIQQAMQNKISGITMLQNQQLNMNQMQNLQVGPIMNQANQISQSTIPQQICPQPEQLHVCGQQIGSNHMQPIFQNQMLNHQMTSPINSGMQSTLQSQPSSSQQQQRTNQMNMTQMQQQQLHMPRKTEILNSSYSTQRNVTPNQYFKKSPSPSALSPSGLGISVSNQTVPSPALVSSPNPQFLGGQRTMVIPPSPSNLLNTPSGIHGAPVCSPIQDDQISQACKDKIQKLRKYIDPLNKMILKLTNDGQSEKISKMKKLLELLTNPNSVTKLDILQKCEIVLEKMDFKKYESSTSLNISSNLKEHQFLTPLLEVVTSLLQSPSSNHTLHRTFGPCAEAWHGRIKHSPTPSKKQRIQEGLNEIPDLLQGEIARLDQRFKVSLDPAQQNGSRSIQLICWLDDKHLPCVPPVSVMVPTDYPSIPPKCVLISHEYATPYLSSVRRGLDARLAKLPERFSISQILDNWEMSVRQACSPKAQKKQKAIAETLKIKKLSSLISSTSIPIRSSGTNSVTTYLTDSIVL